jgi:16S rRNA (uracil1498-N3)-methyltransferase
LPHLAISLIIAAMARRIHLPEFRLGTARLSDPQARYLRDVLRLQAGDPIEVFGTAGLVGHGAVSEVGRDGVVIEITEIEPARKSGVHLAIVAAVPKGGRADWMVEKLAELGVSEFFPLAAQRSVVAPKGDKKFERWERLATEASRQSGRDTVMEIHPLTTLKDLLALPTNGVRWHLSLQEGAAGMLELLATPPESRLFFLGAGGGWGVEENKLFESAGSPGVRLTDTTLRIETAALAAAAIAAVAMSGLTERGAGARIGAPPHRKML